MLMPKKTKFRKTQRGRMTGRSKGFGFVEMADEASANKAIDMFNGQDFGGRKLTVSIARPMERRD